MVFKAGKTRNNLYVAFCVRSITYLERCEVWLMFKEFLSGGLYVLVSNCLPCRIGVFKSLFNASFSVFSFGNGY